MEDDLFVVILLTFTLLVFGGIGYLALQPESICQRQTVTIDDYIKCVKELRGE